MARNQNESTTTETVAETAVAATPAVESSTGRAVILTLDATHAALVGVTEGSTMKRTDYIRARWQGKIARGPIAKELTAIQGKDVPYQIVFQATKGVEGGPDKTAEAPAAETGTDTAAA